MFERRFGYIGFVLAIALAAGGLAGAPTRAQDSDAQDMETALRLASLLRSARSACSANQDLNNDPKGGDKRLAQDKARARAKAGPDGELSAQLDELVDALLSGRKPDIMLTP